MPSQYLSCLGGALPAVHAGEWKQGIDTDRGSCETALKIGSASAPLAAGGQIQKETDWTQPQIVAARCALPAGPATPV